jgi:hypothetical protein
LEQVLAVNAAKDATELVAKLCAYHHNSQTKADKQHLSGYVPTDSSKKLLLCTLKVHFNKLVREWSSIHRGLSTSMVALSKTLNLFKRPMAWLTIERGLAQITRSHAAIKVEK